jgi:ribonuclease P protein component
MAEVAMAEPQQAGAQHSGQTHLARLKRRADFLRVAGLRRKWVTPGVMLQVAGAVPGNTGPDQGGATIQIGFTASRKVGNSVVRNRARRRLKAVVDEVMPLYAKPGLDYVLIARRDTATRPYALLVEDLKLALRKTGALRNAEAAS